MQLEIAVDNVVAIVFDPKTYELYDRCLNWESAQTYAATFIVIAISGDGFKTIEECQAMYDYERRIYLDCFGG